MEANWNSSKGNNTENCIVRLLEEIRKGNTSCISTIKEVLEQTKNLVHCLSYFKTEDKEWLVTAELPIFDCILLAGMHNSWCTWNETFVDEDTKEEILIVRNESNDVPLFEYHREEEKVLFERVCNTWMMGHSDLSENFIELLAYTDVDYTLLMRKQLERRKHHIEKGEIDDEIIWLCKELGDVYRYMGWEHHGYFIDKKKAQMYYDLAQITDDSPMADVDSYEDYMDSPNIWRITAKGNATELKALIMKYAKLPDNEYGIYSPVENIMHDLVGTDSRQPEYRGNVLHIYEKSDNFEFTIEADNLIPFISALNIKFPMIDIQSSLIE